LRSVGKYRLIVFLALLILSSCAQVGSISGGPKDAYAPKIVENGVNPPNESVNFSSKKITIEFDEYIKLNLPLENIVIVPKGINIDAKIDKKKLILDLEGEFLPNTTYQISLNGAIKDVNEGNDSLMFYVFSTGNQIDTLKYSGKIADAYTGERIKNCFVGLYNPEDSLKNSKASYFAKTNDLGEFQINYLKPGKFKVFAFLDANKDMNFQLSEKAGFRDSILEISESKVDSNALLIFQSPLPQKIQSKSFFYPSLVKLGANYPLQKSAFYFENQLLDQNAISYYSNDSIAILLPKKNETDFSLLSKNENSTDTLNFKYLASSSSKFFCEMQPANKDISKSKSALFLFADEVISYDSSLIQVFDSDSVQLFPKISFNKNSFAFSFSDSITKNVRIDFLPNSLGFLALNNQPSEKLSYNLINKSSREYGIMLFKDLDLPKDALVEFILKDKVVSTRTINSLLDYPKEEMLEPGEYSFRIVIDKNKNFKWDEGSIFDEIQAEKVLHFKEKVKIRANWETEVEFETLK
jgi:hypothetical protein